MADIFQEVDEAINQDRFKQQMRKYGPWVVGAALLIVGGVAGWEGWSALTKRAAAESSDQFIVAQTAFEDGDLDLANAGFETLILDGESGYRTLALLRQAEISQESGDAAGAAALYVEAADSISDPVIADLARLKSVWVQWDTLSYADVELRLAPIATPGSPYIHLARESQAAAALRDGALDPAESTYLWLTTNFDTPQGVRIRAQRALAILEQMRTEAAAGAPAETAGDGGNE